VGRRAQRRPADGSARGTGAHHLDAVADACDIGLRLLDRVRDVDLADDSPQVLAMSRLRSAILAVRALNADTARIAEYLGGADNDGGWHQVSFGPSDMAVHDVDVSVELGDGAAAVERLHTLRPSRTVDHIAGRCQPLAGATKCGTQPLPAATG
jgi:hypothetical protein